MSNDTKIELYTKQIEQKEKDLGPKPRKVFKTNGVISFNDVSINLNTLNNEKKCIQFLMELAIRQVAFSQVAEWTGEKELKIDNFTLQEYLEDGKLMLSIAKWDEQKKTLDAMKLQLSNLLSEEGKRTKAIENIGAALGLE